MTIESQRNYWKQYLAFPFFFVLSVAISLILLQQGFNDRYVNFQFLLLDCLFLIPAVIGIAGMMKFDRILIEGDQLYVYSLFGKKKAEIYLPAITSWIEIENQGKGSITKSFTVFNSSLKYNFKSSYYKNYDELKAAIVPYGAEDKEKAAQIKSAGFKRIGMIILTVGFLITVGSTCLYFYQSKDVLSSQVANVSGTVANIPEIEVGSKGARSIRIRLEQYPDFTFRISGSTYRATDASGYVNSVHTGDSIFITIDKGVYERKILHSSPLTFTDKHWNYSNIEPYGLFIRSQSFLTLEGFNQENKGFAGPLIAAILGIIWMIIGGSSINKANKLRTATQF